MSVKLLTEHHLEFLCLKAGCKGSSESSLVKNAILLEITCHGSIMIREVNNHRIQATYTYTTKKKWHKA